jgi:hypothetical protein
MRPQPAVAVTGAGCLCAAGGNLHACLESLFAGRRAPAAPRTFRTGHPSAPPVFEVPEAFFPAAVPPDPGVLRWPTPDGRGPSSNICGSE